MGLGTWGSKSKRPAPSTLPPSSELGTGGGGGGAGAACSLPTLMGPEEFSRILMR